LTPVISGEVRIGSILWPKGQEALIGRLFNGKYALSWTWEELGLMSNKVKPAHCIWLESDHTVWKDRVFRLPKNVISKEKK
jgi:hypothetical protein